MANHKKPPIYRGGSGILGKFIKFHRIKVGLTQGEVGKSLGYSSDKFVSAWERGINIPPDSALVPLSDMLKLDYNMLAKALLKVRYDELLALKNQP